MFLITQHNADFRGPEFVTDDFGFTLHPSKALVASTLEEGASLLNFLQGNFTLVHWEDLDSLPGAY